MKSIFTFLIALSITLIFNTNANAQDIKVTAVFVYETPISGSPMEVSGDSAATNEVVAIGLTLENSGVDLNTGDTIRMGWSEVPNGFLVSVLTSDMLTGTSRNFIVIQSQTAPATAGPWEICIWPTYTSKGFSNTDPNVGNSCKTITVYGNPTGVEKQALSLNKVYFSGDMLNLQMDALKSQSVNVSVYTISGQEVYQNVISKGNYAETVALPLGNLNNGVYLLKLTTSEGLMITEKFVK